jgi:hypothetical protein
MNASRLDWRDVNSAPVNNKTAKLRGFIVSGKTKIIRLFAAT